jgi:predicted metalloprotease with PDZ domain
VNVRNIVPLLFIALALSFAARPLTAASSPAPIREATISVDTTDAHRGIFHSHVVLPALPGAMTFVYPKWIPGEHTPSGPLMQMAGLHVHAGGAELRWTRDAVDMFAFHVDVPNGVQTIEIDFDYMSPGSAFGADYGESPNATQNLLLVLFNHVVVYPAGVRSDDVTFRPSVTLPAGWSFDSALPGAKKSGDRIDFEPVSLTTLVDSPLVAGRFMRIVPIADSGNVHLTLTSDSVPALAMPDERIQQVRNLVSEADLLFGARHYTSYRWLFTLSDLIMPQGLEHHQSSDNRAAERSMIDPQLAPSRITVLAHEYVHSWNGKFRRPAGLATPNYQEPMRGELLWVYEGMTRYLGDFVLTGRSGMRTADEDREFVAYLAANLDRNRAGRNWRPLADTAVAVQSVGEAPEEGATYRRALDYYDESLFVWLDVDMAIRARTNGARSLDDFVKSFFGAPSTAPMVKPYTFDDVVAALNTVAPNDWAAFLRARVYDVTPHPPLGAVEAAGWRLTYNETPNVYGTQRERSRHNVDASFTVGLYLKDGVVTDVVFGSPAYEAGIVAGMHLTSINGRKFDADVLHEEIAAAKGTTKPMAMTIEQASTAMTVHVNYHDGERYPHLQRIDGRADLLSEIIRPRRK